MPAVRMKNRLMTPYIDSHTHLFLTEFDEDRDQVMQRAVAAGVTKMYLPNIDSGTIAAMIDLEDRYPGVAYAMMGLHPCSVQANVEQELDVVYQWLSRRHFSAVGEIGLDFYWDQTFRSQQIEAFSTQIDWALQFGLPIVIHSRSATPECIDIVRSRQNGSLRGIFHCFSGTPEEAAAITDLGFLLGIGGVVTFKKATLPEVLKRVDLEHIVLETDSPYLAPVPNRGKRNESAYLPFVAEQIAAIKDVPVETVARLTTDNALRVFSN